MNKLNNIGATMLAVTLLMGCATAPGYSEPAAQGNNTTTEDVIETVTPPATKENTLESYRHDVARRIKRAYYPPKCQSPGRTTVSIHIADTGAILGSKLVCSSGCPLYDRCALDAVERVGSFAPLPQGIADINAQIKFDYTLFNGAAAVELKTIATSSNATIPKTQSAEYQTAPRTIKQVSNALRAADYYGAQMSVAGLRNDGVDMVVRLIFKQVEMSTQSGLKHSVKNIDDIIYRYALFSKEETSAIKTLSAPIIACMSSADSFEIKTNKQFLMQLADLFDWLDALTRPLPAAEASSH